MRFAASKRRTSRSGPTRGRGNLPRDDAYRYAQPDFITGLSGVKKGSSKYRYAGFEQLVYLSSGVIRYFLEPASRMYAEALSTGGGPPITYIDSSVQDRIIRDEARNPWSPKIGKSGGGGAATRRAVSSASEISFTPWVERSHEILISDKSERRVFSIAFSDIPTAMCWMS